MRVYYVILPENSSVDSSVNSIELDKEIVIGRGEGDLQLEDKRCSRRHASLFLNEAGKLCIRDLGSRNGTYVDDQKVDVAPLTPRKMIRLGNTRLRIIKVTGPKREHELVAMNEQDAPAIARVSPTPAGVVARGSWPGFFECVPDGQRQKFTRYIGK